MALFRQVFGRDLDLAYWRWKFTAAPRGTRAAVAVTPGGEVVGHVGGLSLRVQAEGRPLRATCIVDVMTAPEYRRSLRKSGVFATLLGLLIETGAGENGAALMYGVPHPVTFRIANRVFGWQAAFPLTRVVRPVSELPTGTRRGGWRYTLRPVDRFGPWMDRLWAECRPSLPFATVRDAAFLNWRFVECPHIRYAPYMLWDRWRARARGVAVLRFEWEGQPIATVADWLVPRGDPAAAAALLRGVEAQALRRDVRELAAWLPPGSLEQRLFLDRGYRAEAADVPLTARLYTTRVEWGWLTRHWYFTMADSDNA
jgi:hypothetical protein